MEKRVETLVERLNNSDPVERARVVRSLGRTRSVRYLPVVANLLKDENDSVRAAAAAALGRIGHLSSIDALVAAAADPNVNVRAAVNLALRTIQPQNSNDAVAVDSVEGIHRAPDQNPDEANG